MRPLWCLQFSALVIAMAGGALTACRGGGSAGPSSGEPVVTNSPDDFHLVWSDLSTFTGSRNYTWVNNGTRATVTQSSSGLTSADSVKLIIRNPSGAEVYRGDLRVLGGFQSTTTNAGNYTIRIEIRGATGTIDFRVQRSG
ncbi:MAG: hypothetical protein ACREMN_02705 [Gemmatimonadales bacterium]